MEGGIESLRDRGSYLHVGMLMEGGRESLEDRGSYL